MKITENRLRILIREALLREVQKEDVDFDVNDPDLKGIPFKPIHKKMLDPNISPAKYAAFDAQMDDKGSDRDKALAIAAFALTYGNFDQGGTVGILTTALKFAKQIIKVREKNQAKSGKEGDKSKEGQSQQAQDPADMTQKE